MTAFQLTPLTQLAFALHENKGAYAVLLGSGLSRAAGVPTGWEITLDLIRRVATNSGVEEQSDWAAWYKTSTGAEPDYSKLLELLASTPDERRAILHGYIEPTIEEREEGRKLPTAAHRSIARLVQAGYVHVIVTTNFDRLMENALREIGIEPTIITSVDALKGAEPLTHSKCYLLKLHGDYKDARILNTETELASYPPEYDALLDRIFDEFGLIVCGWSCEWDEALRHAILRAPNRRYLLYWASRGAVRDRAKDIIEHRKGRIIEIGDADGFFSQLLQLVESAEQIRTQHPASIELLLNSTKRYLAKPEFRIQLDELIAQELERLSGKLADPMFKVDLSYDQDQLRKRVLQYEAAAEPLSKMAGVLGRWGDERSDALLLEVLQTLHGAAKLVSGTTIWLRLRTYPAVLIFTAFAIGLTRANRWIPLYRLFTSPMRQEHQAPARLVDTLFLWKWPGASEDYWKRVAGLERSLTPLSDHLLEVMTSWSKSFVGVVSDFELLFERFEVLGSLAQVGESSTIELQTTLAKPDEFVWMAVGRSARNDQTRATLFQELETPEFREALLKAGFAQSDASFLDVFMQNFNRISARHFRW